jgi:hypothetical protein
MQVSTNTTVAVWLGLATWSLSVRQSALHLHQKRLLTVAWVPAVHAKHGYAMTPG